MTKQPFSSYKPSTNGKRSLEEATSEIQREMDVRRRLFDKWVYEGRMSYTDAHDRLERLMTALTYLIELSKQQDEEQAEREPITSTPNTFLPVNSLDQVAAEAA